MRPRDWFGPQRCGPCTENDHHQCVVSVEMGVDKRRDRQRTRKQELRDLKKVQGTVWRCGCWCEWAQQTVSAGKDA